MQVQGTERRVKPASELSLPHATAIHLVLTKRMHGYLRHEDLLHQRTDP